MCSTQVNVRTFIPCRQAWMAQDFLLHAVLATRAALSSAVSGATILKINAIKTNEPSALEKYYYVPGTRGN